MVEFLREERGVTLDRSTVSKVLKANGWTRKTLKRVASGRCEKLRRDWNLDMARFKAEDLIFIDESIFNEKTGWRRYGYAPIGHEARYSASISRGRTWSILPAYAVWGYLPGCTSVREGYFKHEDFITWIRDSLLPTLEAFEPGRPRVIIMNNVSIHMGNEVVELINGAGHLVRFLPPYSPD